MKTIRIMLTLISFTQITNITFAANKTEEQRKIDQSRIDHKIAQINKATLLAYRVYSHLLKYSGYDPKADQDAAIKAVTAISREEKDLLRVGMLQFVNNYDDKTRPHIDNTIASIKALKTDPDKLEDALTYAKQIKGNDSLQKGLIALANLQASLL